MLEPFNSKVMGMWNLMATMVKGWMKMAPMLSPMVVGRVAAPMVVEEEDDRVGVDLEEDSVDMSSRGGFLSKGIGSVEGEEGGWRSEERIGGDGSVEEGVMVRGDHKGARGEALWPAQGITEKGGRHRERDLQS